MRVLVVLAVAALAGCERSRASERTAPATPSAPAPDAEADDYRALLANFGRPAPAVDHRTWARDQVDALERHLARHPETPNRVQILQWLATNEIHVLRRDDRARAAIERLAAHAATLDGAARDGLDARVAALACSAAREAGDRTREIAALERLLDRPTLANRTYYAGRLDDLTRLAVGQPAPAWRAIARDGRGVGAVAGRGRVVVLWFWAAEHPRATGDLSALDGLARWAGSRAMFVGVPLTREASAVDALVARGAIAWPQIWDAARPGNDHPLARCFHAVDGPRGFVIDPRGVIRYRSTDGQAVADAARALIRSAPPATTRPDPNGPVSEQR